MEFQNSRRFNYSIQGIFLAIMLVAAFLGGRTSMTMEIDALKSINNSQQDQIRNLESTNEELTAELISITESF